MGLDTKCSFVPGTSGTGAEQPARAPQILLPGQDRGALRRNEPTLGDALNKELARPFPLQKTGSFPLRFRS